MDTKARILYVDDELDLLDLAASFFEEENLPIETCSDFNEALKLLKKNHYDLVISDAKMPSGSGFDLFKILRNELKYKGKIILVTGNLLEAGKNINSGYDLVIYKPVQFQELIDKVRSLLFL